MKSLVNMFVVLVLVVSTSFPSLSHAMMPHNAANVEKTVASDQGDCHSSKQSDSVHKTAQNDEDGSGQCCDEGMCVGSNCPSLSKYSGKGITLLSSHSSDGGAFTFDNLFVDSAPANRLKRPPKA
jgi:hypothetical protein